MNSITDIYAHDAAAQHLHEIAHGLVALSLHVTKSVELFDDAALIGWEMEEVPAALRLQVHTAGIGANDYVEHGKSLEAVTANADSESYWCRDFHHYDWQDDPNSDISKAFVAYEELMDAGVFASSAAKIGSIGRLKGAIFAHMAHESGLWTDVVSNEADTFILTKEHLVRAHGIIATIEMEAIINACFN